MQDIEIALEPLSPEAFAPYGEVISTAGPPSFQRPLLDNWRLPFATDAAARLQIMRYHQQPMCLSRLERHIFVTEARFPIGGAAGVLVVGDDTDPSLPGAKPAPETLRAFLITGAGVMLHPGTWHGLDCFPVGSATADFLFLSDAATEDEIETQAAPMNGTRTHVADYDVSPGVRFVVTDPAGLMKRHPS